MDNGEVGRTEGRRCVENRGDEMWGNRGEKMRELRLTFRRKEERSENEWN